jgi:hypothetical protein
LKKISIEFATKNSTIDRFEIELLENSVVEKWLNCLKKDELIFGKIDSKHTSFYGPLFCNAEEIKIHLATSSKKLFQSGFTMFPETLQDFTLNSLADLHQKKEKVFLYLANGFTKRGIKTEEVIETLFELNFDIHKLECLQPGTDTNRICFFPKRKNLTLLEPEDTEHFGTGYLFGHVYLDYFTNGRTPLDVFMSKNKHNPVVQKVMGPRFFISLQNDFIFKQRNELETWLKENEYFGEKSKNFPLSEACLGRVVNFSGRKDLLDRASHLGAISRIRI